MKRRICTIELIAKLNKYSERLATSKLSAKWHTPSRIEEDIGKERAKLDELQAKVHELEPQASSIQELINDHRPTGGSEDEMAWGDEGRPEDSEDHDLDILDIGTSNLEGSSEEVE